VRRIALLTDFGTRDPYLAAMKGVIAARTEAPIFDLSHDIDPFDVFQAAWFLRAVAGYWPEGTIFVAVIDPGVGTARRMIALESEGKTFLAPDNGVLTFVNGPAYAVENESLFLADGSTTFHGRDRFAPVAAALANGMPLHEVGPRIDADLSRLDYAPPTYEKNRVEGTIAAIDRFGNAITDIEARRIPFASFVLQVGTTTIGRLSTTYSGEGTFLIIGSTGCVEISLAAGSAAALLHLRRGDRVMVIPT
jgi:S-adenosyl-L-methionine hydrolase (adenosine-forming)